MKNILIVVLSLILSSSLMAAGSDSSSGSSSSSEKSLYEDAVKLVKLKFFSLLQFKYFYNNCYATDDLPPSTPKI